MSTDPSRRLRMMASSSPVSRPSPPGGLQPALTPAPGAPMRAAIGKDPTNQVSTVSGDCREAHHMAGKLSTAIRVPSHTRSSQHQSRLR